MKTLYTDRSDPTIDRAASAVGYNGRKIQLTAAESVELHDTYWSEGSRTTYALVHLPGGRVRPLPKFNPPQFGGPQTTPTLDLAPDLALIGHKHRP